ncbi:MAG: hypothetical protein ABFD08_10705 [Syntrophomonas sp.]
MASYEVNYKKVFDQTASLIETHFYKKRLSKEERDFLLNLLELVRIRKAPPELFTVLQDWLGSIDESINDQIIKETLLPLNLNEESDLQAALETVKELILDKKTSG